MIDIFLKCVSIILRSCDSQTQYPLIEGGKGGFQSHNITENFFNQSRVT